MSLRAALLFGLMLAPGLVRAQGAQNYPAKPIRWIVPFAPGGPTDIMSRAIGEKLVQQWGQQIVVDNKGGAGGNIGAELTAKSAPDGYTVMIGHVGTHAINVGAVSEDPVRSGARLHADHADRDTAACAGRASIGAREIGAGADRSREIQTESDQLRFGRQRRSDASCGGTAQEHGEDRHRARAVQGQRRGVDGVDRRAGAHDVQQFPDVDAARAKRQAARDRRIHRETFGTGPGSADRGGIRPRRLRRHAVVRNTRTRRSSPGDCRQMEPGNRAHRGRFPTCSSAS